MSLIRSILKLRNRLQNPTEDELSAVRYYVCNVVVALCVSGCAAWGTMQYLKS
jgi:hypothetical protein